MADPQDADSESELAAWLNALAQVPDNPDGLDDQLAYDGSDGPQKRPLEPAERALLHRVIGLVAADPRWGWEQVVKRPEIRAVIGDGTQPQARALTARERDILCRMVTLLTSDFWDQFRPLPERHSRTPPAYFPAITNGDIARLNLITFIVTPRLHNDDHRIYVQTAEWAPPVDIPEGWWVAAAPRPLEGPLTWQGDDHGHGRHYAACPPGQDHDELGWYGHGPEDDAWPVITADDRMIADAVHAYLADYHCQSPGNAGMTMAEVARDLGLPWRGDQADAAADSIADAQEARTAMREGEGRPSSDDDPEPSADAGERQPSGYDAQRTAAASFPAGLNNIGATKAESPSKRQRRPPGQASDRHQARNRRR